jgi:Fic family protein
VTASPLLCSPEEKAGLEAANGLDQVDYIDHLVNRYQIERISESYVLELHRIAVKGIYPCAGTYRNAWRGVRMDGSRHEPPHEALVPTLVREMLEKLERDKLTKPAIERAAFALWRTNWIHPFPGGNGRTARALAYLVLCIDLGMMMPGTPSLPTLIYESAGRYTRALRAADASVAGDAQADGDISAMRVLLSELVLNN